MFSSAFPGLVPCERPPRGLGARTRREQGTALVLAGSAGRWPASAPPGAAARGCGLFVPPEVPARGAQADPVSYRLTMSAGCTSLAATTCTTGWGQWRQLISSISAKPTPWSTPTNERACWQRWFSCGPMVSIRCRRPRNWRRRPCRCSRPLIGLSHTRRWLYADGLASRRRPAPRRLVQSLLPIQRGIVSVGAHQVQVAAGFDDSTVVDHHDAGRVANRG